MPEPPTTESNGSLLLSLYNAFKIFGLGRFLCLVLAFITQFTFWGQEFYEDPKIFDVVIDESLRVALNDPNTPLQFADPTNPNAGITINYPDFPVNFVRLRVDADPGSTVDYENSAGERSGSVPSEEWITFFDPPNSNPVLPSNKLTIKAAKENTLRRIEVHFGQRPETPIRAQTEFGLTVFIFFFFGFLVLTARDISRKKNVWLNRYIFYVSLLLFLGFAGRILTNEIMRYERLGYDAEGYVEIANLGANLGGGLYETAMSKPPWVREPLWPWVLRVWFNGFPGTQSSARVCSLFVSFASLVLAAIVGWRVLGFFPALVGVAALAFTPEWAEMSVRVLRHDLVLFLILLGVGLKSWKTLETSRPWRGAVWGLWAAAMMLTQFSFLLFIVPMLIWEAVRTRWKLTECSLAAGILVLLITPHLMFNARFQDSGDPLFSSSIHTLYYYNKENLGKPGFPTAVEFRENPYVGERMSTAEFFFKHHTFLEVVVLHLKGYWNLFVWVQPRLYLFRGIEWLMLPGLIGGIELLRRRKEWLGIVFVFAVLPFAFIAGLGADLRLGMEATVFVAWVWGLGIVACWNAIRGLLSAKTAGEGFPPKESV